MKSIAEKYDARAKYYDMMEKPLEQILAKYRAMAFSKIRGNVLEIGVGTGRNFPYYPSHSRVFGVDISWEMLKRAKIKLKTNPQSNVFLILADAENLPFRDNTFDYIISSCVFCSIPDPVKALIQAKRVLKIDGEMIQIEHVLSKYRFLAWIENIFNFISYKSQGVNINRDTAGNIRKAGFKIIEDVNLFLWDIFRLFRSNKE